MDETTLEQLDLGLSGADVGGAGGSAGLLDRLVLGDSGQIGGLSAASVSFEFAVERELTEADIELLQASGGRALAPTVQRLRALTHRHHLAARLIADGEKTAAVAYATNYSPQHITTLRGDPAFCELVAHYAEQKTQVYLDVHQRLGSLGMAAVEKLSERIEHLGELGADDATDQHMAYQRLVMPNKTLQEIAEMALDRSIAPAKRTGPPAQSPLADIGGGLVVNLNFAEPKAAPNAGPIVDITATEVKSEG